MTDGDAAAFTHLGSTVRAALSERGFATPTAPQRLAIPPLAAGEDTLVIAPTGSGKTETAMLPVFDALVERRRAAAADVDAATLPISSPLSRATAAPTSATCSGRFGRPR